MITINEYIKGRIRYALLSAQQQQNLSAILAKINVVRYLFGRPMIVNSGYRSPAQNKAVGGSKNSHHMQCAAIDISDKTGELWQWCMDNMATLENLGLWLEDRKATPTWVHFQLYPPGSGARIFMP